MGRRITLSQLSEGSILTNCPGMEEDEILGDIKTVL
jgi:hypothetical protein